MPPTIRSAVLLALVALLAAAGGAAVQVDAVTTNAGSATSYSHGHTVSGQDRLLVVQVAMQSPTATVNSVTYAGQPLTQLQRASTDRGGTGNDASVEVWYLEDPPTGSNTVSVTTSAATPTSIGAISLTTVDPLTPINGTTISQGNAGSPSLAVTSSPDDLVLDALSTRSFTQPTVDAGQTQRWLRELNDDQNTGWGAGSSEPGAASVTMSWTTDNAGYAHIAFNVKELPYNGTFLAPDASQEFMLGETVRARFQVTRKDRPVNNLTFALDGTRHQATEVSPDTWEANISLSNTTTDGPIDLSAELRDGTTRVWATNRTITVTPRLDRITAATDPIQGGDEQVVTPHGINDSDQADLRFFCSETSTTPTAASTVCKETTTSYPYPYDGSPSMRCSYDTATDTASHTVNCRVYDADQGLYSKTTSVTFQTDATPPSLSLTSVAGDTSPTYIDSTDDGTTQVVVEGESGMSCRYSTSDVRFSDMSSVNTCSVSGSTATCSIPASQGFPDYHVACRDSLGNGNTASNNIDVTDLLVDWTDPTTTTDADTDIHVPPYTVTFSESDNVDSDPSTLYCRDTSDTCIPGTAIDDGQAVTFTTSSRGRNYLRFRSTDDAGNQQSTVSQTLNINRLGTLTAASDNATTIQGGSMVEISTTSSDPDTALGQSFDLYVCNTTGATASGCTTGETLCAATGTSDLSCTFHSERDDTTHDWYAYMFDDAGEQFGGSPKTGSYTTDSTGPSITIDDPDNISYSQPNVPAAITTGETADTAYYSLDGGVNVSMSQVSSTSFSSTLSGLADGTHTITFWANDTRDNWGVSTTRHFTVNTTGTDLTPPSLTVRSPLNGTFHNTDILLNVTSDESLSYMDYALDGGPNVSMGNVSPTSWNATIGPGLSEGAHTIVFYANDTASVPNPGRSGTIHFTYDTTAPKHFSAGVDPASPGDDESATCSARWTDNVDLGQGAVEENSSGTFTNHSIALSGTDGWTNHTIPATDLDPGTVTCRFHADDTTGNANATSTTFTVTDATPPHIANVASDPSTTDGLDPGVQVDVTANVSDSGGLDHVILQHHDSSTATWTNTSMTATQGTGYTGSFTPATEDNWTYRVWANDTAGLVNTSTAVTLDIQNETGFTVSDTVPSAKARVVTDDPIMDFDEITITNTGDETLDMTTTANVSWVAFNGTTTTSLDTTLAGGENVTFNVTANTTGFPVADFPFRVTVTGDRNGTTIDTATIDSRAVIQQVAGPLLDLTLEEFSSQVTKGQTGVEYEVRVDNVGTQSASGVWLAWDLPPEFSLASGTLNRSIGTLIIGGSASNTLTIDVGTGFDDREVTISAITNSSQGVDDRIDRTVTIGSPPSGGGGSPPPSSGGGSGGGSQETTSNILTGSRFLNSTRTVHLVRGVNTSFPVRVSNIFERTTMHNVSIRFDGPFGPRFTATPDQFAELDYQDSRVFTVNVTSPAFLTPGTSDLAVIVTGDIRGTRIRQDFVQRQDITLRIHTVSREEASGAIDQAATTIDEMAGTNLSTRVATDLLGQARQALDDDEWDRAKELADRVVELRAAAHETRSILSDLDRRIATAQTPTGKVLGIQKRYTETRELVRLSRAAMERGAYDTALQRAEEARLAFEAEQSAFDPVHFLLGYWWMLLLGTVALTGLGIVGRRQYRRATIADRILDLNAEEETVLERMRKTQEAYFVDEAMSREAYQDAMDRHQERLSDLRAERIELRTTRTSLLSPGRVAENLERERDQVTANLQALQKAFYEEESIPEAVYEMQSEAYWERLAEIEREYVSIRIEDALGGEAG